MTAPLRADARRNHEQILAAAREVIVERGPGAPLEEIAARAGVGIGTLYRRFGGRDALLRAVVVDALELTRSSAEQALAAAEGDDPPLDGLGALTRYLYDALDLRVSAVIPLAMEQVDLDTDPDLVAAREASAHATEKLIEAAHADGSLPAEVGFADVGTLLVRLARPLPGGVSPKTDDELARRTLAIFVAGLGNAGDALEETGLSRRELRARRK